jgi:drug/metabolite transporter (DMT)-like permease
MWGDRSGREPARARSPLHMRRTYGLLGAALCIAGIAFVAATGGGAWWIGMLALLAVVGVADAAVMSHRLGKERRD